MDDVRQREKHRSEPQAPGDSDGASPCQGSSRSHDEAEVTVDGDGTEREAADERCRGLNAADESAQERAKVPLLVDLRDWRQWD